MARGDAELLPLTDAVLHQETPEVIVAVAHDIGDLLLRTDTRVRLTVGLRERLSEVDGDAVKLCDTVPHRVAVEL